MYMYQPLLQLNFFIFKHNYKYIYWLCFISEDSEGWQILFFIIMCEALLIFALRTSVLSLFYMYFKFLQLLKRLSLYLCLSFCEVHVLFSVFEECWHSDNRSFIIDPLYQSKLFNVCVWLRLTSSKTSL